MKDGDKTKAQLLKEVAELRRRVTELEDRVCLHSKIEESLKTGEASMKSLLRAVPVGIGLIQNRVFSWVSDNFTAMSGYSVDELTGKNARMLYADEEEYQRVGIEKYARMREHGIGEIQTRLRCKDGTILDILLRSSFIDPQDPDTVLFTVLDITAYNRAKNALHKANDELEARVQQRTEDLQRANEALRAEMVERMAAEKARRQSEQFNRILIDNLADPVFAKDLQGRYLQVNKAWNDFYGIPEGGAIGKTGREIHHVHNAEQFARSDQLVIETGRVYHAEEPIIIKNGKRLVITVVKAPLKNEIGEIIGVVGVARDTTDIKRAEQALRESESKYRMIFEKSPIGIIHFDHNGVVIDGNEAHEQISGQAKRDLVGVNLLKVLKNDRLRTAIGECLRGQAVHYEGLYQWLKTGRMAHIKADYTPITNANDAVLGGIGIIEDITVRKRAETALKESEERFAQFMRYLPGLAYIKDENARIVFINEYVSNIYDLKMEEVLGKTDFEFWPAEVAARVRADDQSVISSGHVAERIEDVNHDGDTMFFLTYKFPIPREGKPPLLGGISIDITKRKQMEEALSDSEKELRSLSSKLLAVQEEERLHIAQELHDSVGQILAAVKFGLEGTLRGSDKGVAHMAASLEPLVPMTQHAIKEVRRLYTGLRPTVLDDFGIVAAIGWFTREFGELHSSISITKDISVTEEQVPELLKIVIFRLIQETLSNVASHSHASRVRIVLRKTEGRLELSLEDNGCGFDLQEGKPWEKLVDGIGLVSMKKRTELAGGCFSIESVVGKGTAIRATWPSED